MHSDCHCPLRRPIQLVFWLLTMLPRSALWSARLAGCGRTAVARTSIVSIKFSAFKFPLVTSPLSAYFDFLSIWIQLRRYQAATGIDFGCVRRDRGCNWVNILVLSPLWPECLRHDTSRRRVGSIANLRFSFLRHSYRLHPTKYPWEHEKWTKSFDHQA